MTLLEALRIYGPIAGSVEERAARSAAARLIEREISRLARTTTADETRADEIVQDALWNLLRRNGSASELVSEGQARSYVRTVVRNAGRDLWRKDSDEVADGGESSERHRLEEDLREEDDEREQSATDIEPRASGIEGRLEQALQDLVAVSNRAADVMRRPKDAAAQREMFAQVVALRDGRLDFAALVASEPGDGSAEKKRDRIYQRHCRARERVIQQISLLEQTGGMTSWRAEQLRRLVHEYLAR